MAKMWAGRTDGVTDSIADDFNSSISFDSRMYRQDIRGSIAHARMLMKQGILGEGEAASIISGLEGILRDLESGRLSFDPSAEDIHMFIEAELTDRIGAPGKRLHTARSRNDQVALDMRMYLRDETGAVISLILDLAEALLEQARGGRDAVMPGYTHLQRAQPVLLAHHLLAYVMMLSRDVSRLKDCLKRMDSCPIGSCALAGTTYNTDREYEAELLGFSAPCLNSMDGVSDRDFCLELLSCLSILMMHLSRLSEELILWSSWEFRFVRLSDAFTTGSSIMPQKKNPDMAELCRGKTGRVYGALMGLLTTLKGLPLAYNKDMQEDKEGVFDALDTVKMCLKVFAPMIRTMEPLKENMLRAARQGFINATDLADYLTKKGMPFREAYKLSGQLVHECIQRGTVLEDLPLEEYRARSALIDEDVYSEISLDACVAKRISMGSTGPDSVEKQIIWAGDWIKHERDEA
ncbi:MAG: argininosuccinate lyase [Clostridia bacterium]|nr:argininosuccinate lyase [Clostridia bacterium]